MNNPESTNGKHGTNDTDGMNDTDGGHDVGGDAEFQRVAQHLSPDIRRILEQGPTTGLDRDCNHCGASGGNRTSVGCFGGGFLHVEKEGSLIPSLKRCPHAAAHYRRQRIARAAETSGTGRLGARQTFDTFDLERCSDERTARAAEILRGLADDSRKADEELDRPARGLLLVGDTGAGKSHLLRAATIEAIDRGVPARFLEAHRIIGSILDSYDARRNSRELPTDSEAPRTRTQFLDDIAAAEVVCLDDLGSEQDTEHSAQILFELLDRLETEQRLLVVATNLEVGGIEERYGRRVSSRLAGMCARLDLAGERDHRA